MNCFYHFHDLESWFISVLGSLFRVCLSWIWSFFQFLYFFFIDKCISALALLGFRWYAARYIGRTQHTLYPVGITRQDGIGKLEKIEIGRMASLGREDRTRNSRLWKPQFQICPGRSKKCGSEKCRDAGNSRRHCEGELRKMRIELVHMHTCHSNLFLVLEYFWSVRYRGKLLILSHYASTATTQLPLSKHSLITI